MSTLPTPEQIDRRLRPKLNDEQIAELAWARANGAKEKALVERFGISRRTLYTYLKRVREGQ